MVQALRRLVEGGIRPDTPLEEAHQIRITNSLLLLMFIGSIAVNSAQGMVGPRTTAVTQIEANLAPIPSGAGVLRLRVDGVESRLIDHTKTPPVYRPQAQVVVP